MANTPTENYGLLKPAHGDDNWDETYNENWDSVDELLYQAHEDIVNGVQGPVGPVGPVGPPVSPKGAWLVSTTYAEGDIVSNGGQSFISLQNNNIGYAPTLSGSAAWWQLFATGYQLDQYIGTLTFSGVQSIVVQHSLNTISPIVNFFVTSGSSSCSDPVILDNNNIQITWYGTAVVVVVVSVPSQFSNTEAAYNASTMPTGGLIEYWPCNDGSGTTLASTSTTANPMILTASTYTWGTVTGFPSNALTFDAISSGSPSPATAAEINPLSDFSTVALPISFAAWVLINDSASGDGRTIVGNGRANLSEQQGTLILNLTGATRALNHSSLTGILTHIAVTYDGSGSLSDPHVIFYINGAAVSDPFGASGTITDGSSSPWTIGGYYTGPTGQPISLAGVGVWNRVLQPFEISHIYALGTP